MKISTKGRYGLRVMVDLALYDNGEYIFKTKLELTTGGNYGYTFRVMPKHAMILDSENLNLVKWITK